MKSICVVAVAGPVCVQSLGPDWKKIGKNLGGVAVQVGQAYAESDNAPECVRNVVNHDLAQGVLEDVQGALAEDGSFRNLPGQMCQRGIQFGTTFLHFSRTKFTFFLELF